MSMRLCFDGKLMSHARRAAGMNQDELALRVGRNRVTISDIERGVLRPGEELARAVADVLGLEPEALWKPPPEPQVTDTVNLTMEEVQVINAMRGVGRIERAKIWAFAMGLLAGGSDAGANAAAEIAAAVEGPDIADSAGSHADSA